MAFHSTSLHEFGMKRFVENLAFVGLLCLKRKKGGRLLFRMNRKKTKCEQGGYIF